MAWDCSEVRSVENQQAEWVEDQRGAGSSEPRTKDLEKCKIERTLHLRNGDVRNEFND